MIRACAFALALLVATLLLACGDDSASGSDPVPGVPRPPTLPTLNPPASAIDPPTSPTCLASPNGCAAPPVLPECLLAQEPGCAEPPELPSWTCPPGWSSETIGHGAAWEHSVCTAEAPPPCDPGFVAKLGESTCRPIGTDCPSDGFLEEGTIRTLAPNHAGTIWYVREGGTGTGSHDDPFGEVADAMVVVSPGDIIAVGTGTVGDFVIDEGVAVIGSCVENTVVAASTADADGGTVEITVAGVMLSNLSVTGPRRGVWLRGDADAVQVDRVEVRGAVRSGLTQSSLGTATIRGTVARDTLPVPTTGKSGYGIAAEAGTLFLDGVVVERSTEAGVTAYNVGTTVEIRDTVVHETLETASSPPLARGIRLGEGARGIIERCVLADNPDAGLLVVGDGTELEARDLVIRDSPALSNGELGIGLAVGLGAHATVSDLLVERAAMSGVFVGYENASAELDGLLVRETLGAPNGQDGSGVSVLAATLSLRHGVVTDTREVGLHVYEGGFVQMSDTVVTRTATDDAGDYGMGLVLDGGAQVEADRVVLTGNHMMGVSVDDAVLTARDLSVEGTLPVELQGQDVGIGLYATGSSSVHLERTELLRSQAAGLYAIDDGTEVDAEALVVAGTVEDPAQGDLGEGIVGVFGASVTVRGFVIDDNQQAGVKALDNAKIALEDGIIRNTRSRSLDGSRGGAALVGIGAELTLSRVESRDNRDIALLVSHPGSTIVGEDVVVRNTKPRDSDGHRGQGLQISEGASVELRRALFERQYDVAMVVGHEGTRLTAEDLVVRFTESRSHDHRGGRGIGLMLGSTGTVRRALLEGNREVGVVVFDVGTRADLEDVVVTNTFASQCAASPNPTCVSGGVSYGGGSAVSAVDGAEISLLRFLAEHSAMAGLQVGRGGVIRASHGTVRENVIGAHIQDAGFDWENLVNGTVRYVDNGVNLDGSNLPLPVPEDMLETVAGL